MTPDASGKFRGIRVPDVPWSKAERQDRRLEELRDSMTRLADHAEQLWVKRWIQRALEKDDEIEAGRA